MIVYGVLTEQSIGRLFAAGIGPGTIRMSVGLAHPDDIRADLDRALAAAAAA